MDKLHFGIDQQCRAGFVVCCTFGHNSIYGNQSKTVAIPSRNNVINLRIKNVQNKNLIIHYQLSLNKTTLKLEEDISSGSGKHCITIVDVSLCSYKISTWSLPWHNGVLSRFSVVVCSFGSGNAEFLNSTVEFWLSFWSIVEGIDLSAKDKSSFLWN